MPPVEEIPEQVFQKPVPVPERNDLCPYPIPKIDDIVKDIEKAAYAVNTSKFVSDLFKCGAIAISNAIDLAQKDKLYIGLIKDLHHMGEIDYTVSDGYDCAQTAMCFLYQFIGRTVHEIYGKDRKGKEITIKLACYREVDRFIDTLRNRPDSHKQVEYIDFTDYKALPMDPVNCFEKEQTDYGKYDELVAALQLSALELAILNCYMNGMRQAKVCAELGIGRGTINHRKASIRQRYYSLYGSL